MTGYFVPSGRLDLRIRPPTLIDPVSLSRYGDRLLSPFFFGKTSQPLRWTSSSRKSPCCVRLIQSTLASFSSSADSTPVFLSLGEPLAFFRNRKTYAPTRNNFRRKENLFDSMKDLCCQQSSLSSPKKLYLPLVYSL